MKFNIKHLLFVSLLVCIVAAMIRWQREEALAREREWQEHYAAWKVHAEENCKVMARMVMDAYGIDE